MMTAIRISRHAQQRRKEMGITEDRIQRALDDPDMTYPTRDDRTCYQREDIVVVVQNSNSDIVTVLWHGREHR